MYTQGSQRDVVILTDQLRPRIWAQMRGGEGGKVAGPQPMSTAVHMEPK